MPVWVETLELLGTTALDEDTTAELELSATEELLGTELELGTIALDEETALELELGATEELLGGAVWLDELVTIKLLLDGVLELIGTTALDE
jgi:hypothetical protein